MAPALDEEVERGPDLWPHIVVLDGERRQRGGDVEHAERIGRRLDGVALRGDARGEAIEDIEFDRQRAVGGVGDLGFQPGQLGGGEAHLAGQRLAMDEGRIGGWRGQLLGVLRRDLDEIA